MHAIRGGWVGQTFALAKSNESEGRKSRIRRSKEERKAMVESFIQKYQKLNNGSFPSLNLTHKEVGGSFYTVREIFRDIIQENRVLGPALFSEESLNTHQLEQNPLGSIALEPQYPLTILSNGSQLAEHEYQSCGEELSLTSDGHHATPEIQIFDNGKVINIIQVDTKDKGLGESKDAEMQGPEVIEAEQNPDDNSVKEDDLASEGNYTSTEIDMVENRRAMNGSLAEVIIKEFHEMKNLESHEMNQTDLQVNGESEGESVKESAASRSTVTPLGDVKVETFPVRAVTLEKDMDGTSIEVMAKAHTFGENDAQKVALTTGVGIPQSDSVNPSPTSRLLDEKEVTKLPNSLSDKDLGLINEEDSTVKVYSSDILSTTVISEQSDAGTGAKAVHAPSSMKTKYLDRSNGTDGQLKTEKEEVDNQRIGSPQNEGNPTLDRINLESWDGVSKNPRRPQGNPFWAVFKAIVNAFVKFWSE